MTEITTAAGRALLGDEQFPGDYFYERMLKAVLAIEAEARQQEREQGKRLADAVRYNLVAGVRLHSGKITDEDFDATTREVIDALREYDAILDGDVGAPAEQAPEAQK